MKYVSRSLRPVEVEVLKVKFSKTPDLGIEFSNAIDPWVRLEFKFRHQIEQLRKHGKVLTSNTKNQRGDFKSLWYAVREQLD